MTIIITIVLALVVTIILFVLLSWVNTPYYRIDKAQMIKVFEMVLTGQATENDWQILIGVSIRHSEALESIRQQCLEVDEHYYIGEQRPPYLFSQAGLNELTSIFHQLKVLEE